MTEITIMEGIIVKDGVQREVDMVWNADIHAVQWHGVYGYIEWKDKEPERISNMNNYANELQAFDDIMYDEEHQPEPSALEVALENRRNAYPPLGDFADAYVHMSNGDATHMTAYVAACNQVKTDYPKPV